MAATIGISLLIILLAVGMPVAFALAIGSIVGMIYAFGFEMPFQLLRLSPFRSTAHFVLTTVPLFIFMAELMNKSDIARPLFDAAFKWWGHVRGGLAMGTVVSGAAFAACAGASAAAAASFGPVAIPQMQRHGYSDQMSAGAVTVCGTLAAMIPPSVLLILYGSETETSIGQLLVAGVVPGLLLAALYCLNLYLVAHARPSEAPLVARASWRERFASLRFVWPVVALALVVIGVIYLGVATPSEAAAIGATGALVLGFAMRRLTLRKVIAAAIDTLESTAMIFMIIVGAGLFSTFLTTTGATSAFLYALDASEVSPGVILLAVVAFYVFLGLFLDAVGAMLVTLPVTFPLMIGIGYDPVWFGIFMVVLLEMGLLTPPVGLLCYITSGTSGVPLKSVFVGAARLLPSCILLLILLYMIPGIALYLPEQMFQ